MAKEHHDNQPIQSSGFRITADLIGILGLLAILLLVFSARLPASKMSPYFEAAPQIGSCIMDRPGYLRGKIYGEFRLEINLVGKSLSCDGMPQPDGQGIRLFFSAGQNNLAFVLGIEGEVEKMAGNEQSVNLTVINEKTGRFYSTAGLDRCWTLIDAVEPYQSRQSAHYRIDGVLYCSGALASLSDRQSITLGDIHFSGRFSYEAE